MAAVEGVRAKRFPTDAERDEMLKSVEKMVLGRCKKSLGLRKAGLLARDHSVFEDYAQACRLMLSRAAAGFDLGGVAKWSTFAHNVITHAINRCHGDHHESTLRGQTVHLYNQSLWAKVTQPDGADDGGLDGDGPDGFDADDFDTVERSLDAVHRAMFAPALDALTPSQRRLVEMVAFRRLTLPQVADQLGQKLDICEKNFRGALAALGKAGFVTDEMAAAFGVTIRATKPARKWQPGERTRFLDAVQTTRPAADIAFEFNVSAACVGRTRRNIASLVARHARAEVTRAKREARPKPLPYAKREPFAHWPADEQKRLLAALDSDRTDRDIAAEFRISRVRARIYRDKRPNPLPFLARPPAEGGVVTATRPEFCPA